MFLVGELNLARQQLSRVVNAEQAILSAAMEYFNSCTSFQDQVLLYLKECEFIIRE